jgi:hypothetical protein
MKDISTQDLIKELLLRIGDDNFPTCIEIQLGKIMQIAYYPNVPFEDKFWVSAESHSLKKYNNIDDAVKEFFRLYNK